MPYSPVRERLHSVPSFPSPTIGMQRKVSDIPNNECTQASATRPAAGIAVSTMLLFLIT